MDNVNKKIRKKVRFDFYHEEIEETIKKSTQLDTKKFIFNDLFDYYILNNNLKTNLNLNDEIIEIEPNSIFKEGNLYFFMLSNLRSDIIPTKKKIGKERIDIKLDDDEYIGEFTGILYDHSNKVFTIQINKYGISPSKVILYLYNLKNYYLKLIEEDNVFSTKISMIVNPNELENITKSKEIRQIKLKSSSISLKSLKPNDKDDNGAEKVRKIVNSFGNVNFEISIKANYEETNCLEKKASIEFINMCKQLISKDKKNSNLIVKRKENDDSKVETVDFLLPKLNKYISFSVEPRKSIGRDLLRINMTKAYDDVKAKINNIIKN